MRIGGKPSVLKKLFVVDVGADDVGLELFDAIIVQALLDQLDDGSEKHRDGEHVLHQLHIQLELPIHASLLGVEEELIAPGLSKCCRPQIHRDEWQ